MDPDGTSLDVLQDTDRSIQVHALMKLPCHDLLHEHRPPILAMSAGRLILWVHLRIEDTEHLRNLSEPPPYPLEFLNVIVRMVSNDSGVSPATMKRPTQHPPLMPSTIRVGLVVVSPPSGSC